MMGFLKRLLGGDRPAEPVRSEEPPADAPAAMDPDAEERAHELEVLRGEQARLDELQRRQLRYEQHVWTPPAQGGERRADDSDQGGNA